MLDLIFYAMIFVGLVATLISLALGLLTMGVGGEFNNKFGNMFMRFRLLAQALAVVGIVGIFWLNDSLRI